jgi:small ligand-binding sensory domain FIST
MRALAASSTHADTAEATLEVADQLRQQGLSLPFDGAALVFASKHHAASAIELGDALGDLLGPTPFLGWTGASAFCRLSVPEGGPGLVVLAIEGVEAHVRQAPQHGLGSHVGAALVADAPVGRLRLLAAPREELDAASLLGVIDEQDAPLVGAVCVGDGTAPGCAIAPGVSGAPSAALMSLTGCHPLIAIAQGARPLGEERVITRADGVLVQELDGRPALEALLSDLPVPLHARLPELAGSLLAGLPAGGDAWRMRHVTGIDPQVGAVAVAAEVTEGSGLVFALRDGEAARADVEEAIASLEASLDGRTPLATLVFSCEARNEATLGTPLYDVGRADDRLGGVDAPVVGVSGGAELASIGGHAELFSYTAVVVALIDDERGVPS